MTSNRRHWMAQQLRRGAALALGRAGMAGLGGPGGLGAIGVTGSLATLGTAAQAAGEPGFPSRPVRFVVPFAAASGTDLVARLYADRLADAAGTPVVVDNKAGANGVIGAQAAAKADADGYTVLIGTNTTHAANASLVRKLGYDPVNEFMPVTLLGSVSLVMVVPASTPAATVAEFTELARRQPGKLTFGAGSASSRVAVEMYKSMAGVDLLHVPYKSNPPAVTDLIGGQLSLMIADTSVVLPHVASGKLRALAVTGPQRLKSLPAVPTMAEAGLPGYELTGWFAAFVPARTPPEVVRRLNELFVQASRSDKVREGLDKLGGDVRTSTPQELALFAASETQKWSRTVRAAKIEPE